MSEAVSIPDAEVAPPRPGRQLAVAREGCALSVADVARELRLSLRQVEALEADDYQRLPGAVFVRGYIRSYAHLVKLDPEPLLASAERQLLPAAPAMPEMPASAETPLPTGREFRWHKYAIVLLVLLVPLVIFEFYRDDAGEATVTWRPVMLPQPQVVAETSAAEAGLVAQAPALDDAERRAASGTLVTATAAAGTANRARAAAVERIPGRPLIRFMFDRESWVEIQDRNGRVIFSRLNPAGTEQMVSGQPPFTLVVGNASGVRLSYNDRPVSLAPHTKVDVAHLTLE